MLIVTEERCRCQQAQQASNLQKIRMALEGCDIRSTYSTGFMAAACALPKVERSPSDLPLKLQPARRTASRQPQWMSGYDLTTEQCNELEVLDR